MNRDNVNGEPESVRSECWVKRQPPNKGELNMTKMSAASILSFVIGVVIAFSVMRRQNVVMYDTTILAMFGRQY